MKLKIFWDKIKPLDYKKNPIGSLKLELYFWIVLISFLSYISGSAEIFNIIYGKEYIFHIKYWIVIIISVISWMRLAIMISRHLKEKNE